MSRSSGHHFPCPCGAELADECPSCARTNPLGSMRIEPGIGSIAELGLRNVRAIARARTERTNAKEVQK